MKRLIDWHLKRWKEGSSLKPLLLRGAGQVGKTFAVRKLGKSFEEFIEINLEHDKEARRIFEKSLQPDQIIQELNLLLDVDIAFGKTLLFLDEIQECPAAMQSLKFFCEKIPSLHVIAAGSFLNFAIEKNGLPAGKVESLYCCPLSFFEFLVASEGVELAKAILENKDEPLAEEVHQKLLEMLGKYLAIGGMPEVVSSWVKLKNPKSCFSLYQHILEGYRKDFPKYCKDHQLKYARELFNKIPCQIGKQFKYSEVHEEYKKRELSQGLDLLSSANVIYKVHHTTAQSLPLGVEGRSDWFKVMFIDVALSQAILGLDPKAWFLHPQKEFLQRSGFLEAFLGQELLAYSTPYRKVEMYYWKKEEKQSRAEVDFCFKYKENIIPIEVKNGDGRTLKSLHRFLELHPNSPYGIRFSTKQSSKEEKIVFKPLYDVVSLAHLEQKEALCFLIEAR
ncbi:MAG: AAA family ATPase [Chlamydiota bacterium]